jgi:hypothetical protein
LHFDELKVGRIYRNTRDGEILKLNDKSTPGCYELVFKPLVGHYGVYGSGSPEFDLEEVQILESQVWAPRREGEYVEVEMFAGGVVEYIGCHSNISGEEFIEDFLKHYELIDWMKEAEEVGGARCGKCGEFFEYANRKRDFRCWSCRNGW